MDFMATQSPEVTDIQFDHDDLVGIALGGDDPIFKHGLALDNMYRGIVDESGDLGSINIADGIENAVELDDDFTSEPGILDMVPDDTELAIDAIDADQEIEAAQEILSGEADDDIEIFDCAEEKEIAVKEDAVSANDVQNAVQDKLYDKSDDTIKASDIQSYTKTKEDEEVREACDITIANLMDLF